MNWTATTMALALAAFASTAWAQAQQPPMGQPPIGQQPAWQQPGQQQPAWQRPGGTGTSAGQVPSPERQAGEWTPRPQASPQAGDPPGSEPARAFAVDGRWSTQGPAIGMPVITADGARVGQIIASVQRPNAPDDVVIYFEDRGFDMTTAPADVQALREPNRDAPVVVGGGTVIVREQNLTRSAGGDALVIAPDALAALGDLGASGRFAR